MTYNFNYISKELRKIIEPATLQSHKFHEVLGYRVWDDAYVAPFFGWKKSIGCVIDKNGQAIPDSAGTEWKEDASYYDFKDYQVEHKRVVFLGFLPTGFGHSYTDDLRKLWFLKTEECKDLIRDGYELVYTTSKNQPIPQVVLDVFSLAGLDFSNTRHINRLTRFDEVVVPANCFRATEYGRIYCQEYVDLIDCIKSAVPETTAVKASKLYFTRTKFTAGLSKERGERDIEQVFRGLGYEIVIPEDYSVAEQIQMVENCDHFSATEGSVAHLSLFCKPHTDVVILCKANYLNFHQIMVNEFADLNTTYIEAHHSSMANSKYPWWGPFYLCINHYLVKFARRPILYLPFWAKFSYWEYTRNLLYRGINKIRKMIRVSPVKYS